MSTDPPTGDGPRVGAGTAPRLVAAVVCGVQAVVLLGFCAYFLVETLAGQGDDTGRALMSVVLIAVFAVALGALSVQWLRASPWVRTPTIVWNLLLLPVAWGLVQSGRAGIALAVGGVALAGLGAAVLAGERHDLPGAGPPS